LSLPLFGVVVGDIVVVRFACVGVGIVVILVVDDGCCSCVVACVVVDVTCVVAIAVIRAGVSICCGRDVGVDTTDYVG